MDRSEQLQEFAKCLADPTYAIETYLETFDQTQNGYVPFHLFPKQKELTRSIFDNRFTIVSKPRQAGITTTTAACMAIKVSFYGDEKVPDKILILANRQEIAQEFLKKIKEFLEQIPRWVWGIEYVENPKKSIFLTDSKKHIILPTKCEIKALATSKDALRGFTPTTLIMDEAAYIDNGSEVYGAALPSLGTGGKSILISTPNGYDDLYYKIYDGAVNKRNKYNIIEMRWYQDLRYNKDLRWIKGEESIPEKLFTLESYEKMVSDGYKPTSQWYEDMSAEYNGDTRKIAQELDVSFLGSGGNVIDEEYVQNQNKDNVRTPIRTEAFDNGAWVWADPVMDHQYIMGCLPPNEKVLTDNGLKNIQDVGLTDKLVSENGDYVNIINKQIYPVVDENIYEIKVDNTFRTTTFTKEHPLLVSKPNLKRNYKKTHNTYKFNERYWDFDFKYVRAEDVEIGDWIKVPNIYKKEDETILDNKWNISTDIRYDFEFDSPLKNEDFWWFMGMWLGDGWLGKNNYSYSISICFGKKDYKYVEKTERIIKALFKRSPSFIEKESTYELVFNSKFLYYFILENFGQYSYGKKISEWVKFIPQRYKKELISGYFDSDGCWVITKNRGKINSKVSFVSINLGLLESIQDIIFSLGVISSLNKLRDSKIGNIKGKTCNQKETYNLCLANNDSIELINLIYKEDDDKLNKFNINDFYNINNRIIKSCHFDKNKDFIYFRIKDIKKNTFTGNVYNFECDTHTFMCHHITTHNCDVSRGDSEDFSTIEIIDFDTREQVFEYQGKIPPDILAELVYNYGEKYKAYTVVDITGGMGVSTVLKLLEMDYKRLHYDDPKSKILSTRKDLGKYRKYDNKIPGFNVGANRLNMVAEFERSIRQNEVIVRSSRLISEMKTFVYKNGRPDHMDGYHDDLLMSVAMCLWVLQTSFKNLEKVNGMTKAMLTSWVVSTPANSAPVFNQNHQVETKQPPANVPNGEYMWLLGGMK
jgi:hypothetical protein